MGLDADDGTYLLRRSNRYRNLKSNPDGPLAPSYSRAWKVWLSITISNCNSIFWLKERVFCTHSPSLSSFANKWWGKEFPLFVLKKVKAKHRQSLRLVHFARHQCCESFTEVRLGIACQWVFDVRFSTLMQCCGTNVENLMSKKIQCKVFSVKGAYDRIFDICYLHSGRF